MGGLLHLVQQEGPGRAAGPPSSLLGAPNVTANPPAASIPITVLLYDGPLLCGFNVVTKGLKIRTIKQIILTFGATCKSDGYFTALP